MQSSDGIVRFKNIVVDQFQVSLLEFFDGFYERNPQRLEHEAGNDARIQDADEKKWNEEDLKKNFENKARSEK